MDSGRFWRKVDKSGGPDACWIWVAGNNGQGYGKAHVARADGLLQQCGAHRLAYELANGPIPDGMRVLHTCDNPPCCNPKHLFLGTPKDNSQDMVAKGRSAVGSRNSHARLVAAQVVEIRRRRLEGATMPKLAAEYGVTKMTIHHIITRKTWKHV